MKKVIQFALKVVNEPDTISPADYENLNEERFSNDELMEIMSVASFAAGCIFLVKAGGIDVDKELDSYLQEKNLSIGF